MKLKAFGVLQLPAADVPAGAVPDPAGQDGARFGAGGDGARHHLLPGRVGRVHAPRRRRRRRHQGPVQPPGHGRPGPAHLARPRRAVRQGAADGVFQRFFSSLVLL